MAQGWVQEGFVKPGWVKSAVLVSVTMPAPDVLTAATNFGDPGALETLFHSNPGPYADEPIVALGLLSGVYLFGQKMPSAAIVADAIGREATLLSISDLPLTTSPLGGDLIGSLGASEIPRMTLVFDNRDRSWSKRLIREPVLLMPLSIWVYYGGTNLRLVFQGQVTRVRLTGAVCEAEVGEP